MSTYRKDSELSRFNQYQFLPFDCFEQTATVVKEAIRLNQLNRRALDVTVGPLVNLWGFGPKHAQKWCRAMPNWPNVKLTLVFIIWC